MTEMDKKQPKKWLYPIYGILIGIIASVIYFQTGGFGISNPNVVEKFLENFFNEPTAWAFLLGPVFLVLLGFIIGVFFWKKSIGSILLVIFIAFCINAGILTHQQLTYTPEQLIKAWGLVTTDEIAKEYNLIPWDVSYRLGKHEGIRTYNPGDGKYRFKKKVVLYWLKKDGLIKNVKK